MRLIHYIEIENFKRFGPKQRIDLDHPAVLIGPNNCGKTSAIQALALWSQAVQSWWAARRDSSAKERTSSPLNRLNIAAVPVQRTRFFWHDTKVRTGNKDVHMVLTVGVEIGGQVRPLSMRFRNQGEDIIYCTPAEDCISDVELIQRAAGIRVELLYPLSGLEIEEPVLQPGRINVLLGQGQTASVLRNLCLAVKRSDENDWRQIVALLHRLFDIKLGAPQENARGAIDLTYQEASVKESLDISSAGRGFQQILLILAYLYSHKQCVLLVDEPDAHLEILRQKQIYVLLRDIAAKNGSQVVMVTHSEVILEEALETNLTLLLHGAADDLAKKTEIKESLRVFGAQHYIRARDRGYVLYVEGGTDIDILRALAEKTNHPASRNWDERINSFYVENNYPDATTESELERVEGGFGITPRDHFFGLRKLLPELKGLALLDNDGRNRVDEDTGGLSIRYWKRYEVENYFVTPRLLREFALKHAPLFESVIEAVLDDLIKESVFAGSQADFDTWKNSTPGAERLIWEAKTERMKLSVFAEEFFRRLAGRTGAPMLMRKGELHRLVELTEPSALPPEVFEKLDLLYTLFEIPASRTAGQS
jgi:energy-coupling factor transporter ATP-binding protein EcfA2